MATYIQGITGYVPQIQEFRPDLNFYNKALQLKQSKYDAAHEQLSTLYGSLLNAPMLHKDNIEARDQFFKTIDQDIQKMSGMDLSLQQNVNSASSLFNQLLDDDYIVKDMSWTKTWQNELQRANGFRNCIDPDKCGGAWWEDGETALYYKAQDFKNATREQTLSMGNARFTPYQDIMGKSMKIAKEAGLNIKRDTISGKWIVTTKNGPELIMPLSSLLAGTIGKDPAVLEYYQTKSYVDGKNWINANAENYGSVEAAEAAYFSEMVTAMDSFYNGTVADVQSNKDKISGQKEALEEKIRTKGTTSESSLAQMYRDMNNIEGALTDSEDVYKTASGSNSVAVRNGYNPASMQMLERALASYYMTQDIMGAAQVLAYKDYEQTIKADPYALENVRQANRITLEDYKFQQKLALEDYKYELKEFGKKQDAMGSEESNIPNIIKNVLDAVDVSLDPLAKQEAFDKTYQTLKTDISAPEFNLIDKTIQLSQSKANGEKENGVATQDLIEFGDLLNSYLIDQKGDTPFIQTDGAVVSIGSAMGINSGKKSWVEMNKEEKAAFVKTPSFRKYFNRDNLTGTEIDDLYNNFLVGKIDMTNSNNKNLRGDYLEPVWKDNKTSRDIIATKNAILEKMDAYVAEEVPNVIAKVKDPEVRELLRHYIDPATGKPKDEEDFAMDYARANWQKFGKQLQLERVSAPGDDLSVPYIELDSAPYDSPELNKAMKRAYDYARDQYRNDRRAEGLNLIESFALGASRMIGHHGSPKRSVYSGLHDEWRRAWNEHADIKGGLEDLGLMGAGSKATMAINYPLVKATEYLSAGTSSTLGFMKNALYAGDENTKVSIGGLGLGTGAKAQAILQQLYTDMINVKSSDKKAPLLDVTYQDIADNDGDWTKLNIKLNPEYVQKNMGTKGSMRDYGELLIEQGLNVKLRKSAADNPFRNSVKRSDMDNLIFWKGEYKFDSYPETTRDFKMVKTDAGAIEVNGEWGSGIDENGKVIYEQHYKLFEDPRIDLDSIKNSYENMLKENSIDVQRALDEYNRKHGIKNPSEL